MRKASLIRNRKYGVQYSNMKKDLNKSRKIYNNNNNRPDCLPNIYWSEVRTQEVVSILSDRQRQILGIKILLVLFVWNYVNLSLIH